MNQTCVPVDNRRIIKELFNGLYGLPHIYDFATLGKFFDDNLPTITEIIAKYYQYRLSNAKDCSDAEMNSRVDALFSNCFANMFPFMPQDGFSAVKTTFLNVLKECYNERIIDDGGWTRCEIVSLSLDSYVINCYKDASVTNAIVRIDKRAMFGGVLA